MIEDAPQKQDFSIVVPYNGLTERTALVDFLYTNRLRTPFLWKPELYPDYLTVVLISEESEAQLFASGAIEMTLRTV